MEGGDAMGHELQGLVAAGRTRLSSVRGGSRGRSAQGTDGTGLGILGLALLTLELDACLSRGQPGHWTGFSGGLPHQIPVACPSAWVTTHNVPNLAICPPVKGYKTSLLAHKGERGNQAGSGRRGSGRGGDCDSPTREDGGGRRGGPEPYFLAVIFLYFLKFLQRACFSCAIRKKQNQERGVLVCFLGETHRKLFLPALKKS